ncbi:MAG: phosphoenolpyruvate carboxykinase, partial [Candidatus Omnitrophota bacterium]
MIPEIKNSIVAEWVREMAKMCQPDCVVLCDGSEAEKQRLTQEAVSTGELLELNHQKLPGCYYHRTAANDVARTEHLTFICSRIKEDAGPTNNWMDPHEAYRKLANIFNGSMKGRTMYIMPFMMGVSSSETTKIGVQLTDSIYVVLNMRIMTRMGQAALDELGHTADFTRCLHSKADLDL